MADDTMETIREGIAEALRSAIRKPENDKLIEWVVCEIEAMVRYIASYEEEPEPSAEEQPKGCDVLQVAHTPCFLCGARQGEFHRPEGQARTPTHTDLMVPPEDLDEYLDGEPGPAPERETCPECGAPCERTTYLNMEPGYKYAKSPDRENVEGEVVAWKGRTVYVQVDEKSLCEIEDLEDWRADERLPLRVRITRLATPEPTDG